MLDYRPDLDPRTPDLVTAVEEMIPTTKGYRVAPKQVTHTAHEYSLTTGETYPTVCAASKWLSTPGGIVLIGTNKRLSLYEYTNGFINVSKAGNYDLSSSVYQFGEDAAAAFDITFFGDVAIACHKSTNTQVRSTLDLTIATLFADLTDGIVPPPKASTCCVANNFVFLGDCASYSTVTGSADILAWSALGDHLDWAVNPTITQASFAQFNDTPGAITAVRPLRDGVVVFKAESMYLGRYVGTGTNSPIWDFVRVSDKIGCVGHRSVINIDNALVFVGRHDFYIFDGTRPTSITRGIYEAIYLMMAAVGQTAFQVGHDRAHNSVWFGSSNTSTLVWNYRLDRWGALIQTNPIMCQTNADDFRSVTMSGVSGGTQVFTTSTNHLNLYTLYFVGLGPMNRPYAGTASVSSSITTGAVGEPDKLRTLSRVNPIYSIRPDLLTGVTLTLGVSQTPGSWSTKAPVTISSNYRFDLLTTTGITSNFFRFKHSCNRDCELVGFGFGTATNLSPAGSR